MKHILPTIVFYILIFTVFSNVAVSQAINPRKVSNTTFSQIGFDAPELTEKHIHKVTLEEIMALEAKHKSAASKHRSEKIQKKQVKIPKEKKTRAMLKNNAPQDLANFIVPRLKGPYTDKNSKSSITTNKSWKTNKSGSCTIPSKMSNKTIRNLKEKADALKELLYRFSANNSYYDSQCKNTCINSANTERPTALAIKNANGGSFSIMKIKNKCHYRLTKKESSNWLVIKASRLDCTCLPK